MTKDQQHTVTNPPDKAGNVSDVDTTQATWNSAGPLVDIDEIEPDESLLADVRKTRITTPATRVLLVLIVLGVGFLGGALVDRWQRPSSSATSSLSSLISQFRRGAAGGSGAGGAAGGAALGFPGAAARRRDDRHRQARRRQQRVHPGHRRRRHPESRRARARRSPSRKPGTVNALTVGATVIVQGKTSSDGTTVAATTITPSTGFGRGGGRLRRCRRRARRERGDGRLSSGGVSPLALGNRFGRAGVISTVKSFGRCLAITFALTLAAGCASAAGTAPNAAHPSPEGRHQDRDRSRQGHDGDLACW